MKEYKITSLLDESGSKYHRCFLSLKDIDGKIIKVGDEDKVVKVDFITQKTDELTITEEIAKNSDLIWINWVVTTPDIHISQLKSKYGFKLVVDVDDVYDDKSHVYFNEDWEVTVVRTLLLADYVTTTNNYLAGKIHKHNPNIAIIPNILPYGWGQFVGKPEEKKYNKGKLRVGLYGSLSHLPDFKLFKPILNRLAKNKNIVDNVEFVLLGVNMPEIIDIFAKKKNINYRIENPRLIENYMSLLDEVDVVCQPLVDNPHNRGKSGLKNIECSVKDVILLGSELYSHKEFSAYFKCETPIEYEKTIELLLENYEEMLSHVKNLNLEENKYEERVGFVRELVEVVSNKVDKELENVKIYSITYEEGQIGEYENYFNTATENLQRFEWNPILDIVNNLDDKTEYLGVLSWKFPLKTNITKPLLYKFLEEGGYKNYDFINLSLPYWKNSKEFMEFSYAKHPKLKELLIKVLDKLGIEYTEIMGNYNYSNYFLLKSELYREFVNDWIMPSIKFMEEEIWEEVNVDANYENGEFFNYETFLLERLVNYFVHIKQLKTLNIF